MIYDITETHVTHGAPFLATSNVRTLGEIITPLVTVMSYGRTWSVSFPFIESRMFIITYYSVVRQIEALAM